MGESPGPEPNPLAAVHPRAVRVCAFLRRSMRYWLRAAVITGGSMAALVALAGLVAALASVCMLFGAPASWPFDIGGLVCTFLGVGLCLLFGFLTLAAVLGAFRLVVITLFFVRYSLAQLLTVILSSGACVTLIIQLPDTWKAVPMLCLVIIGATVLCYIAGQDPEGPQSTPAFLREALRLRKARSTPRNDGG